MLPETSHHIRNGLCGVYSERKRLLSAMLEIAELLTLRSKKKIPKKLQYKLHYNLIEQIGCVKRMDGYLDRITKAERREAA